MELSEIFSITDELADSLYEELEERMDNYKLPTTNLIELIYNSIMNLSGKLIADVATANPGYPPKEHIENYCDTLRRVALEYFNEEDTDGHTVATFKADPQPQNGKVSFFGKKK
jgi:hypothetical protein